MPERPQSKGEEIANSVAHGVGFALSVAGLVVLVVVASLHRDPWQIVSCSVYGASLVLLYGASTLYHALPWPGAKRIFRVLDHATIFLLIAGTYTPFTLVVLRGGWGWSLFGIVWAVAAIGVTAKFFFVDRFRILSPLLYLAMGWIVIVAVKPLLAVLPLPGFVWLMAGGVAYSGGLLFYAAPRKKYAHFVWHLFVLAGSAFHFVAVLFYALPPRI